LRKLNLRLHPYQALLVSVLILSALVVGLRGTMSQSGAVQNDATNDIQSLQGVTLGNIIWADNFSDNAWRVSSPNTTSVQFQENKSLNLTANFNVESTPQSVVLYREANISLADNPIIVIRLTSSIGVHYGVRFSGVTPAGIAFNAWREGSVLQHRQGLGVPESLRADLTAEADLANSQPISSNSRITRIWFYLETPASSVGTFNLQVESLQVSRTSRTTLSSTYISGNFYDIIVALNIRPTNQSLFQAYASFYISGSPGLMYTLFLASGQTIAAQGYIYTQGTITTHQVAVLLPSLANGVPSVLPDTNSSSLII